MRISRDAEQRVQQAADMAAGSRPLGFGERRCANCGGVGLREEMTREAGEWFCMASDCQTAGDAHVRQVAANVDADLAAGIAAAAAAAAAETDTREHCRHCGEPMDAGTEYEVDGLLYCLSCYRQQTRTCDHCGERHPIDNLLECPDGRDYLYCQTCFERYYRTCDACGEMTPRHSIYRLDNGDSLCGDCFSEDYLLCAACGRIVDAEAAEEYDGYCYCSSCFEDTRRTSSVHNYSYRPEPQFYGRAGGLFFGIELEVENMSNGEADTYQTASEMPDFIYCKEDGSINNGFEIVTHPMSWKYLRDHKDQLADVLRIRRQGFRSYNTETCGMHIHLSADQFNTPHLYRFLKLFYENPAFIVAVSQRKESNIGRWASVTLDSGECLAQKAKDKYSPTRYSAVNLQNSHTVEIRIFRGTLREESFWKNLEFCHAAFAFTKNHKKSSSISEHRLRSWVSRHADAYPNLSRFLSNLPDTSTKRLQIAAAEEDTEMDNLESATGSRIRFSA